MLTPHTVLSSVALVVVLGADPRPTPQSTATVPYAVAVTPDNATGPTVAVNTSGYSAVFRVQNTGSNSDTYNIACAGTAPVSCTGTSATQVSLGSVEYTFITAFYNVGSAGIGKIRLYATAVNGEETDSGWFNITVSATVPTVTIVVPGLTSGERGVVSNRQPIVRAFIKANGGVAVDTTKTVLKWRGETITSLARANRGLIEWEVDSTRWLGIGDSALIEVKACNTSFPAVCQTMTRWAVLQNDNKPVLGFTGMPLEALGRVFSAPFGPGFSVSGGEVETGFSTPSYFSMGVGRSAGLVYSTRQSYPRALVPVDLELTWPAGTATRSCTMVRAIR